MAEEIGGNPSSTNPRVKGDANMGRTSASPLRQRPIGRASTFAELSSPLRHRRSSTFSDSVDDAKQSIRSSTDDLLLPRIRNGGLPGQLEPSHWHSTPLALALLPAIGGILFQDGSAVVTDITLLGLAAIFLNWSVRLPWEWYHSAQSAEDSLPPRRDFSENTIIEEDEEEDQDHQASDADPPKDDVQGQPQCSPKNPEHARAASELRTHELLALFACFLSPLLGAWLLHAIRSQLSRPSEGLVSNYNLTVFLLAAEIRPLSHLIKMVQARTLHLQRAVGADLNGEGKLDGSAVADMAVRLDDLEGFVADTQAKGKSLSSVTESTEQMKREVRNSLQPDLDALNRAVRRYEKRMVALTMQTESRLQELEARMSDAITLAAAAERSSNKKNSAGWSSPLLLFDWITSVVWLPLQLGWAIVTFPAKVANVVIGLLEDYVGNKVRREMKTAGRTGSGHGRKSTGSTKASKKAM